MNIIRSAGLSFIAGLLSACAAQKHTPEYEITGFCESSLGEAKYAFNEERTKLQEGIQAYIDGDHEAAYDLLVAAQESLERSKSNLNTIKLYPACAAADLSITYEPENITHSFNQFAEIIRSDDDYLVKATAKIKNEYCNEHFSKAIDALQGVVPLLETASDLESKGLATLALAQRREANAGFDRGTTMVDKITNHRFCSGREFTITDIIGTHSLDNYEYNVYTLWINNATVIGQTEDALSQLYTR